jgi:hypothetical protein
MFAVYTQAIEERRLARHSATNHAGEIRAELKSLLALLLGLRI